MLRGTDVSPIFCDPRFDVPRLRKEFKTLSTNVVCVFKND